EIARAFRKAEGVEFIVIVIAGVEERGDDGALVGRGILREIEGEVEVAGGRDGVGTIAVSWVGRASVEVGIYVVAIGLRIAVVDPAVGGSRGVECRSGNEITAQGRRLGAARCAQSWRHRCWAIEGLQSGAVGIDPVAGIADVRGKRATQKDLPSLHVDE